MGNILKDFRNITFKQLIQLSFFWIVIGFVGLAVFETLHRNCNVHCGTFNVLRWIFVGIFAFAGVRNLIGGAIPNLFRGLKEMIKERKKK